MKRNYLLTLAVLALAACQQDKGQFEPTPNKLQIEPVITKATEVNFEAGDKIGLTVVKVNDTEKYADNACMTFGEGVFSGDLVWYGDAYSKSNLYAYYPYDPAGTPASFAVETDQTAGIGASDLMFGSKADVLPVQCVTMVFKHKMTKIVMEIENEASADIVEVALLNTIPTAAVNVAEGTVTAEGEVARILACNVSEGKWAAIVVPQTAAMKLEVVLSDRTVVTQPLASMTLASGGQYSVEVRLVDDNMSVVMSGEIENWTDEGKINFEGSSETGEVPIPFEEFDTYFEYDGVRYETVELGGRKWMAEPLCFIPSKYTPSSNPADSCGVWYPYSSDGTTCTALTDEASIKKFGYLYYPEVALKADEINADNYKTFEGVQGICPAGWHIPTREELVSLCADTVSGENDATVPATNTNAVFYDAEKQQANVVKANEAGFNFTFSGSLIGTSYNKLIITAKECAVESYYGSNKLTYVLGSTINKNTKGTFQAFSMMTTFTSTNNYGKLNASLCNLTNGVQVRCVKDAE